MLDCMSFALFNLSQLNKVNLETNAWRPYYVFCGRLYTNSGVWSSEQSFVGVMIDTSRDQYLATSDSKGNTWVIEQFYSGRADQFAIIVALWATFWYRWMALLGPSINAELSIE